MEKQIEASDFVLMVCTETYFRRVRDDEESGKGLGVRWEGGLIYRALYRDGRSNTKFIPVLFETGDSLHIPGPVGDTNFYLVHRLISRRHTAVGDLADFQGASDEHT